MLVVWCLRVVFWEWSVDLFGGYFVGKLLCDASEERFEVYVEFGQQCLGCSDFVVFEVDTEPAQPDSVVFVIRIVISFGGGTY